ncbi:MAG: right-handed parallel beta-helix repeat-containing protein [Lutibacter sp.]|jgi:parallel beta-helix repeat protein
MKIRNNLFIVFAVVVLFCNIAVAKVRFVSGPSYFGPESKGDTLIIADHFSCSFEKQTALEIEADSVTVLNPNNYEIVGWGTNAGVAVMIKGSAISIEGLNASNFHRGAFHSGVYGEAKDIKIKNCYFFRCGQSGIELYLVKNAQIENNNLSYNGYYGLMVSGGGEDTISNNYGVANFYNGIVLSSTTKNTGTGNSVEGLESNSVGCNENGNDVENSGDEISVVENMPSPSGFALFQNYPNPFNPITTITYTLPREMEVELTLYNQLGQKVATLVDGVQSIGEHSVRLNAENFSAGVYLYTLKAEGFYQIKKMTLTK